MQRSFLLSILGSQLPTTTKTIRVKYCGEMLAYKSRNLNILHETRVRELNQIEIILKSFTSLNFFLLCYVYVIQVSTLRVTEGESYPNKK